MKRDLRPWHPLLGWTIARENEFLNKFERNNW